MGRAHRRGRHRVLPAELDGFGAVVTTCAAACAETSTLALDGSSDQERRTHTLMSDV